MPMLTQQQRAPFWKDGVLVADNAISPEQIARLKAVCAEVVRENCIHINDWGDTMDGEQALIYGPGNVCPARRH